MFKVIYIIYIHMSRLNKNLQSKKRHMYMFTLSQKTITQPNSLAFPNSNLASLPPFFMCCKCRVVTEHTGGKQCCMMASESLSPVKWTTVVLLDEGIDVNCSSCRDAHEFPSLWHWTWVPDWPGHHNAHAGYSHGSVTFQGMQQTHQCSTCSYHFHQKVLADILAACVCAWLLCNTCV